MKKAKNGFMNTLLYLCLAGVIALGLMTIVGTGGSGGGGGDDTSSTYEFSGYVRTSDGSGISGVTLAFSNAGGSTTTSSSGYYSKSVAYGWSGTVTPSKSDYTFSPSSTSYSNITSNRSNQNYTGEQQTRMISGYVQRAPVGIGLSGVTINLSGNASDTDTTDSNGSYSFSGLSNGSYTVTPSLTGYTFDPTFRNITISGADVSSVYFTASAIEKLSAPQTKTISGAVELPEGSPLDPTELIVRTIAGNKTVDASGRFAALEVIDEGLGQIVFVENTSGNTIAVAYLSADDISAGNFTIGPEEMALGLIKLNPYLMVLSPDQEELVLAQAVNHSDFAGLVNDIENALVNAPENALDYETYPYIYQKAVRIGIEVIASYSGSSLSMRVAYANLAAAVGAEEDPHIADVSGPKITLVNPKQTFYGVDLGNGDDTLLRGRGGILTTNIGWRPPWEWITTTDPYEKDWDLGDGTFTTIFYKGFNIYESGWLNPFVAPGKGTYGNFLKMFGIFMKTAGLFPGLESLSLATLSDAQIQLLLSLDNIPDLDFSELAQAIWDGVDWKDLVFDKLPRYISQHWDEISLWVWQEASAWTSDPDNLMNAADHMHSLEGVMDGVSKAMPIVSQALTVIEAGNEWIPFFYDLVVAPWKLEYTIRQTNGVVTGLSALIPPTASFMVDNTNPAVGETVNYDASDCSDDHDSAATLEVRWDFNGDGTWDTSWTTDKYVSYTYSNRGNYRPLLEVKDSDGLTARASHDIVVGSQESLKIVLTWGAQPYDIDSHLYTPDIEGSTYHIYYANRCSLEEPPYAWLDRDDVSSYGPETIWFERIFPGRYAYSVYNYSGSPEITTSSAHVEVIDRQGVIASYDIPTSGFGRWWNVFTLDGSTGQITEINTISDSGTISSSLQALRGSSKTEDPMPPKEY